MKVWILLDKPNEKFHQFENQSFVNEAQKLEIDCDMVYASDFEIIVNREDDKSVIYQDQRVALPDVVIPRTGSKTTYFTLAVLRHLERLGVWVLNPAESIEKAKDKLSTFQILASHNIPIPKTILAKYPVDPQIIEKELKYPFVLKKVSGSSGKGVLLVKKHQQLEDILGLVEEENSKMNLIFQEFISHAVGQDLRVLVIGGRAIGAMKRTGKKGDFKANYSAGGSTELFPLTPEIEWLAVESAKVLNLEIAGVDLLFSDNDSFFICEVNANPGFEGFQSATGINIPQEIFGFVQLKSNISL